MLEQKDVNKIKEVVEEFFEKMAITISKIEISFSSADIVDINIKLDEPQIFIGERGQTLFEIQRLLRTVLNKKLQEIFYLNLDINDYKKKKIEYLKSLAKDLADEAVLTREEKVLSPMPAYERRIIHTELAQRQDVSTESQGEGFDRHVIIKPR